MATANSFQFGDWLPGIEERVIDMGEGTRTEYFIKGTDIRVDEPTYREDWTAVPLTESSEAPRIQNNITIYDSERQGEHVYTPEGQYLGFVNAPRATNLFGTLKEVAQETAPIWMAMLAANYLPNLLGGGAGAGSAAAGDIAFAAADAAQLAAQGLGEAQIAQTLATTGLDAFVAADMAQLAAQGLSASQIASTVGATAAGTGGSLFNTLSPAQAVAQGVSQFPNAAGASNAAQAAGSAINAPATTPTGSPAATTTTPPAATSGASGLLSSLTPAQLTSLLNAGVGLLGAGALGSGGGGGGGAVNVGTLPQQAPPTYDQNYFDALNAYYGAYLPGQEANTSMLQSWYNRQPYQVDQFQMPVMAGQTPQQPATQQQPTGGNMGFFSNIFGSLFDQYLKPNRVTPAAQQPTSLSSMQPSQTSQTPGAPTPAPSAASAGPSFVAGPGSQEFGGFRSQAEYDAAVAQNRADQQAYLQELINYQPSAPFLASYFANPETIPRQHGESIDRAILRLKAQDKEWADRQAARAATATGGDGFVVSNGQPSTSSVGLGWLPSDWTQSTTTPTPGPSQVIADETGFTPPRDYASSTAQPINDLQGLFQQVYGRMGTPEEIANVQGMGLGDVRNILQQSLANWNAMQNR